MINIAINGFGRIGRKIVRTYFENSDLKNKIKIVAINDLSPIETSAHLFEYDSVHGKMNAIITNTNEKIIVDNTEIAYFSEREPSNLPWKEKNIDIVLECTGLFTSKEKAQAHIDAGSKRVIISAPGKGVDATIVFGVNENTLSGKETVISNASCTTNCLAPIIKALNSNFDIKSGIMTTIHAYTGDQNIVDAPHSDLFRSRAAALSMIPTKTGAAEAIGEVIPELKGKLKGMAVRVPTPNVSMVDLSCVIKTRERITEDLINHKINKFIQEKSMFNVLEYNEKPLVSIDYNGNQHSSIFDATQTICVEIEKDTYQVKICAWYDNESGFSRRMLDLSIYFESH